MGYIVPANYFCISEKFKANDISKSLNVTIMGDDSVFYSIIKAHNNDNFSYYKYFGPDENAEIVE